MLELILTGSRPLNVAGQVLFTGFGDKTWIVPAGVTSISAVTVGRGVVGGGGLSWRNAIPVNPGDRLTIAHRLADSSIITADGLVVLLATAGGSKYGGAGGKNASSINDGGGNGGNGATAFNVFLGGGAGGYLGDGGSSQGDKLPGLDGTGGGGGAGAYYDKFGNGGGVALTGMGANGKGGDSGTANGQQGSSLTGIRSMSYGGGNWIDQNANESNYNGATRIIWGKDRAYPATNCGDV